MMARFKKFFTTNCIGEIHVDDYTSQVSTIEWYTVGSLIQLQRHHKILKLIGASPLIGCWRCPMVGRRKSNGFFVSMLSFLLNRVDGGDPAEIPLSRVMYPHPSTSRLANTRNARMSKTRPRHLTKLH